MILIVTLLYQTCRSGVAQASNYRDVMYFYADDMGAVRHTPTRGSNITVKTTRDLAILYWAYTRLKSLNKYFLWLGWTVASLGLVSPGAATDGCNLFLKKKSDDLFSHRL